MKATIPFFLIIFLCVETGKVNAQTVDPATIEALKRKAAALQRLDKNTIRRNPDSALKVIGRFQKTISDATNKIKQDALQGNPKKGLIERYMNAAKNADTIYTTVQLSGSLSVTELTGSALSKVKCTALKAPLVRTGSSYSMMLNAGDLFDKQAGLVRKNKVPGSLATYIVNSDDITGQASYLKHDNSAVEVDGFTLNTSISQNGSEKKEGIQQFLFTFDTLSHIGQVSYQKFIDIQEMKRIDTLVMSDGHASVKTKTSNTIYQMPVGVSAVTDPANWDFNALQQDSVYNILDSITGNKLTSARVTEDGNDKPVLQILKTAYGFRVKCDYSHRNGSEVTEMHLLGYIGMPVSRYEAIIYPVVPVTDNRRWSYEHWLPKGPKVNGSNNKKGDDSLKFYIVVREKNDTTRIQHHYTVKWKMEEVTHYPGFCNNYPNYTESPDISADLTFHDDTKADENFESVTDSTADSKPGKGEQCMVKINCMDYAAWGKLTASITLDDGSQIEAAVPYYDHNKGYITIPFDKDDNKLSDWWEDRHGLLHSGYPLTWDDDYKPTNQRDNGDGFTLFEEYRGFAMHKPAATDPDKKDVHERTDPNTKDAFVYDKDDLFKDNYEQDNPSDLNWHYLSYDKGQLLYYPDDIERDLSRWVNFNKVSDYFYSEQYCLVLMYSDKVYSYDSAMTACSFTKAEWDFANIAHPTPRDIDAYNAGTSPAYATRSPMKRLLKVEIFRKVIADKMAFVKDSLGEMAYNLAVKVKIGSSVKHEIGHCIGIHHHIAPAGAPGNDNHDEQSAASNDGVTDCVMRYYNLAEKKDAQLQLRARKRYCRKGESGPYYYRVNTRDADGNVTSYTEHPGGTKGGDNCYGQISVKSKPGE